MLSSDFQSSVLSGADAGEPEEFMPLQLPQASGAVLESDWRPLLAGEKEGEKPPGQGGGRQGRDGRFEAAKADSSTTRGVGDPADNDAARSFSAGYELGVEETRADMEVVAESLVKSLQELGEFRARLQQRYERELLALALGVARKVLRSELQARPDSWLAMIRDGVRQAVDREEVRIRVPGVLATFLETHLSQLRAQLDEVKELVIVADPALSEGGCVIDTRFGELDLGIDTQIERVERELTRVG